MTPGWLGDVPVVLVAAKAVTLAFGAVLTYLAYKAFRRTRSRALQMLSIGIALLTAGAMLGGVLNQVFDVPLGVSASVESVFTAAGFAAMTYSLFAGVPGSERAPS